MIDADIEIIDPRLGTDWPLPGYATDGSAGIDLRACIDETLTIEPGAVEMIPVGIKVAPPDGYASVILPRSGRGHREGLVLGNLVGLIDPDYRGGLGVSAWNRNPPVVSGYSEDGPAAYSNDESVIAIDPGDRIAQLVFMPIARPRLNVVESLDETARGTGGFGSSGK